MRFKRQLEFERGVYPFLTVGLINIFLLVFSSVFFFSRFWSNRGVEISLPRVVTSNLVSSSALELLVTSQGLIFLKDELIPKEKIIPLLREAKSRNLTLLLKIDSQANLALFFNLVDLARKEGIQTISVATGQR